MPKGKKGKQQEEEEIVAEEKLQAVVIAQAFELEKSWAPLSCDVPPALFPLANVPLIDYTMQLLVGNGVKEIFVFCGGGEHGAKIKQYLKISQWAKLLKSKNVHLIEGEKSVGECLRECEKMRTDGSQIHNGDMVVVTGPLVSNHDVQATLAKHKATKKKDKAMIMTLALKRLGRWHRTRSAADATLWGIDKDSQELLIYDTEGDSKKLMKIETDLLKQSRSLTLANDMIDTRVYVCTPQVLIEFESNFDFHTMEQLVADLLLNAELYGHKMFVDEVSDRHYAAPVRCVHSYDAVSRDVLARWVYPNALDTHWHHRPSAKEPNAIYACARGNSYKEASARLSRSAKQGPNSALGRGTTVGENSVLERCVVGDGCRIGENCKLYDCYVWPGCVIEDGVTITNAVVASNCRLGAGCTVSQGCLVGENCAIGAGFTLQPYHRITTVKEKPPVLNSPRGLDGAAAAAAAAEEEEEEESESSEDSVDEDFDDDTDDEAPSGAADAAAAAREERADRLAKEAAEAAAAAAAAAAEPAPEPAMVWPADEVGEGGVGRLWTEDDPEPEPEPAAAAAAAAADGLEEIVLPGARGPLADYSNAIGYTVARPRPMNALLPESDEEVEAAEENTLWNPSAAGKARFVDEMRDTLKTRMAENCALETILFEMKSLRLSHNADIVVDLLPAVVPALLGSAPYDPEAAASKEYTKALKKVLKQWGGLIEAFLRDTQDQLALLGTVFDWVCDGDDDELPPSAAAGGGGPDKAARIQQVGYIIQFLYEFDVVEPEAVLEWAEEMREDEEEEEDVKEVLAMAEKLIAHCTEELEDSDSEDSDDSSSEDESDDDDDDEE